MNGRRLDAGLRGGFTPLWKVLQIACIFEAGRENERERPRKVGRASTKGCQPPEEASAESSRGNSSRQIRETRVEQHHWRLEDGASSRNRAIQGKKEAGWRVLGFAAQVRFQSGDWEKPRTWTGSSAR